MMSYTGNVIGDIPFGQGLDNDGARLEEELGAILRHPSSGVVVKQLVERALSRKPDNEPFDQDSPPLMVRIIDDENDPVSYSVPSEGTPYFELPDQEMPTTEDAPGDMWPKLAKEYATRERTKLKHRDRLKTAIAGIALASVAILVLCRISSDGKSVLVREGEREVCYVDGSFDGPAKVGTDGKLTCEDG